MPGSSEPISAASPSDAAAFSVIAGQRLLDREAGVQAGVRRDGGERLGVAGSRVRVGRDGDRDAGLDEGARRRAARAHPPRRAGEEDRDRAGPRERPDLVVPDEEEVVGRRGAELGGEQRAAGARELVRVDAEPQAGAPRPRSRIRRDSSTVKTPSSQKTSQNAARPSSGDAGNDLVDDDPDPLAAVVAELGRDLVRREEGRHESREIRLAGERLRGAAERAELVLDGQPVAGLRLGGRRAVRAHRARARPRGRLRSSASVPARVARTVALDPAALGRDRGVALAGEPPADLGAAVAEPDRMGVRVDEPRNDGAAGGVERPRPRARRTRVR